MIRLSFGRKKSKSDARRAEEVVRRLEDRSLVLIGLMGCGKSAIGRRLASRLSLPFVDADEEIEKVAGMSISDIFAEYGETHFRDREAKVIARLLGDGPQVLATGGGAFMNADTRCAITRQGVSVWLKAELPLLMKRVMKRPGRPLLQADDPEKVMRGLIEKRYPVYAEADVTVTSRDVQHGQMVNDVIRALAHWTGWDRLTHD